jgi:hypothetical protein
MCRCALNNDSRRTAEAAQRGSFADKNQKAWHLRKKAQRQLGPSLSAQTAGPSIKENLRNDSVELGSAVVSTAVFGVSPKNIPEDDYSPIGEGAVFAKRAGETPTRATEAVALPYPTAWLRCLGPGQITV